VIGLGAATYVALRNLAGWQPDAIGAVCGSVISGVLIVAMLFEGWPATRLPPGPARAVTLALAALVALALKRRPQPSQQPSRTGTVTPPEISTRARRAGERANCYESPAMST
jgi:hypothetical protein